MKFGFGVFVQNDSRLFLFLGKNDNESSEEIEMVDFCDKDPQFKTLKIKKCPILVSCFGVFKMSEERALVLGGKDNFNKVSFFVAIIDFETDRIEVSERTLKRYESLENRYQYHFGVDQEFDFIPAIYKDSQYVSVGNFDMNGEFVTFELDEKLF